MKGLIRQSWLITAALLAAVALIGGCTQRDDVVTVINHSDLTLEPQNLPTPPAGMIYELWVSKETVVDTSLDLGQATSLGRFSYVNNDSTQGILDEAGQSRSATFQLHGDFQTYRTVFVSVQRITDPVGTRPGAIMSIAYIPGGLDIPIRMLFPQADSLWQSTCRFNMEGISDRNHDLNDGHGLWFSNYRWTTGAVTDTTGLTVDSSRTDTLSPVICGTPPETCNIDSLKAAYLFSVTNIRVETVRITYPNDTLLLGLDSLLHIHTKYDAIKKADSTYPYIRRHFVFNYDTAHHTIVYDIFSQDDFGVPTVSEWGWQYCGWVASPQVPVNGKLSRLTPPAWRYKTYYKNWMPGSDSGIVPSGLFSNIHAPNDSGSSFALNSYLPPFPGSDFLNVSALQTAFGVDSLNFLPTASGNSGTVFVSVEPRNRLTASTNFPLIAFVAEIPNRRDSLVSATVSRPMVNATATLLGNEVYAFPVVAVKVKRY